MIIDKSNIISSILSENGVELHTQPIPFDDLGSNYYVFPKAPLPGDSNLSRYEGRLKNAKKILSSENINIKYIFRDDRLQKIEPAIRLAMENSFSSVFESLLITIHKDELTVWLEALAPPADAILNDIQATLNAMLRPVGIHTIGINFRFPKKFPTKTDILRAIRKHSPISADGIGSMLRDRGFLIQPLELLPNFLDTLRKDNLIIRKKNGDFVVTLEGLTALGSGKGKRSPDVERLLDLCGRV